MTILKPKKTLQQQLSAIKLPQLPQVLLQLVDICRSPEVDIRLIAQTVSQDIALTTKILQLANSAFIGARSQFRNIDHAVIFLGVNTVRNLAISVSVHEIFDKNGPSAQFDNEEFWYHCLFTALISKTIAEKAGYDDPGAAYLTGLLHDTGKYLLARHFGESYQTLINKQNDIDDLVNEEKKAFNISHCDVGKWLLDSWNMSEEFGNAVRDHHNRDTPDSETNILSRIIRLANTLTTKVSTYDEQTIKDASILCISPASLQTIVEEQTTILEDLAQTLGIPIKEPEREELSAGQEKNQQRLYKKIESRAKLYGFMESIIQAQTINRVYLALEESLSFLFDCDKAVLLLQEQTAGNLAIQGSFRNKIARTLKEKKYTIPPESSYLDDTAKSQRLLGEKNNIILSSEAKTTLFEPLFQAFQSDSLLGVPIRISPDQQGLMLLCLATGDDTMQDQEEILQLLSLHVGNRLYQETLKEEYAIAFAKERIAAVEEVARSIAFEISNPLRIIQNYILLLATKDGQNQTMSQELSIINRELARVTSISKQLGDLSTSPGSKQISLTNINEAIGNSVHLFQKSIATESTIDIDFVPAANIPALWLEINPFKQILGNLITNSIDALGKSGTIEVHCHFVPAQESSAKAELVVTVSDNGPGVPPSIANTIFRAGKTTKEDGHAGLGLAIVNKLTKDISGRIYHSTGKEGNTLFTFHFPVTTQPSSYEQLMT